MSENKKLTEIAVPLHTRWPLDVRRAMVYQIRFGYIPNNEKSAFARLACLDLAALLAPEDA